MPRNKRIIQNPEEKKAEIINCAHQLFLANGYEATSMSKLSQEVGISPNTIYWYFKDKDDILVEVLQREFMQKLAEYHQYPFTQLSERLLWVTNQLEPLKHLISTVHSRTEASPAVAIWHERFHQVIESLLSVELNTLQDLGHTPQTLCKIIIFSIEGMLSHPLTQQEKQNICQMLVDGFHPIKV